MLHVAGYCLVSLASEGGGREVTKFYTGRLCPMVQPLTLLYTISDREGTVPFCICCGSIFIPGLIFISLCLKLIIIH